MNTMNNNDNTETIPLLVISSNEIISIFNKKVYKDKSTKKAETPCCSRHLSSFIYRMRLNAWKTKFSNVKCICGDDLSVHHVLFVCHEIKKVLSDNGASFPPNIKNINELLYNNQESIMFSINLILNSQVGKLL